MLVDMLELEQTRGVDALMENPSLHTNTWGKLYGLDIALINSMDSETMHEYLAELDKEEKQLELEFNGNLDGLF